MIRRLSFLELPELKQSLSLALGVFDGIHLGHQALIGRAVEHAKKERGLSGVVTFEPHPIAVLAPERAPRRLLASLAHKERILDELGVDLLIVVPFDREFAELEPEAFLAQLGKAPRLSYLTMGSDWRFGKGRRGDISLLQDFGRSEEIRVEPVDAVMMAGERISSTRIRQALRDGSLIAANEMLGRAYSVMGEVLKGKQLGRKIGFPTANLIPDNEQLPSEGVWAVDCRWEGGDWHPAVANLGRRPTVESDLERVLEVHLLDWEGELYGQTLEVRFRHFLRSEKKFDDLEALKAQIVLDVETARLGDDK